MKCTILEKKAKRLRKQFHYDKNIQCIGVAEKSEYNLEERLHIYTIQKTKKGVYPDSFEGVKVVVKHSGKFEVNTEGI
jgi:hypothetical protein